MRAAAWARLSATSIAPPRRSRSLLLAWALLIGLLIPIIAAQPAMAAGACALKQADRTTWTGGGNPGQWNDPNNWSNNSPGNSGLPACVPEGGGRINVNPGAGADSVESFRPMVLEGGMTLFGQNKTIFHDVVTFSDDAVDLQQDGAEMIFARGSTFNVHAGSFPAINGSGADDVAVRIRSGARMNVEAGTVQPFQINQGRLLNDGRINVDGTSSLAAFDASIGNTGIIDLRGGSDLVDEFNMTVDNTGGQILKTSGGSSVIEGELDNAGGKLEVRHGTLQIGDSASDVMNYDPAEQRLEAGTFKATRSRRAGGSADLVLFGADVMVNSANVILSGKGRIIDEVGNNALRGLHRNTRAGDVTVAGGKDVAFQGHPTTGDFLNRGRVVVSGKGSSFLHTAGDPAPFSTSISDTQTLAAAAASGSFISTGSTSIRRGGRLTTRGDYIQDSGVFDIRRGGRIRPGGRLSVLGGEIRGAGVIDGTFVLGGTQRAKLRSHRRYDRIKVLGRVIFKSGATLHLQARRGFKPRDGAAFKILEYRSHRGRFRKLKLSRLRGYSFRRVTRPRSVTAVANRP